MPRRLAHFALTSGALLTALVVQTAFFGAAGAQGRGGRGGAQIQPGQECPPGMTEVRPGNCQTPEFPVPSIVDYRPKPTLVTDAHLVPKARYAAIDFHGHPQGRIFSAEALAGLVAALDSLNVGMMISADNLSGTRLQQALDVVKASPTPNRVRILAGINFQNVGPGWADRAIAQLEADLKAGAVGVGEISKGLGLSIRKADGTRLHIDDPDLDPVWDACARLNIPVFIHTADPQEFFEPIDYHNERWLELSLFGDRRYPADRFPRFEELLAERDRMFKKHPKTRFVAAHLAWLGNDLGRLSRLLDSLPNVSTEVGAVLYDLGRQPRAAHDFLVKYQDRVLFGKDAFEPSEYPYYWRVFETKDEYFDYYRNYHAFWKLYGLDLPDDVLKKLYYQNALRLTPGLPRIGPG
ncbi:MAG TPA: amidohydrolase family protein [Vicinamibacterales bacterium]|nr:amidohydrolase family protein [Vicinamibacterales bacterium]